MYIRQRSLRFSLIFLSLIVFLVFFSIKLAFIQVFHASHLIELADRQHSHVVILEPVRGTIFDRQLRPLAINEAAYSLYANPRIMEPDDKEQAVAHLPGILNVTPEYVHDQLDRDKLFVWMARKMSMGQYDQIKQLNIQGLGFLKESKRHYPNHQLASHLIGFAGMDNEGLEGIEKQFDRYLRGKPGRTQILRDARQRDLLIERNFIAPQQGFHLVLTIDETIQYIAERALDKAFEKYHAVSATIVVMDPHTGEILALANRPTYDLQNFAESAIENRTNRAVAYVYEPGSAFKIVTASAALEEGVAKEEDKFFCENGEYRIANHILHDVHPLGTLTFKQVIEQSSNICTTKIAQKMGAQAFYKYAHRFRFGIKTGIDLVGEVTGVLKPPSQWSKVSIGAIPIGHEVLVTPLQLTAAMSAIANDGVYMKPYVVKYIKDENNEIIKSFEPHEVDRVISSDTSRRMKVILQGVVENGTGTKAKIEGVTTAGKTGTAQKIIGGQYSHNKFYATFIGFAPVEAPRLVVAVVVDEPHPQYYGGTVAAPVFQEVVQNTLKYLNATEPESPENAAEGSH